MKYINTMLNSLSAITLSETGKSALKVAGGRPLSEFSADLIDVDDILIHKAEDALQILQEYRPQFQHDHPVGAVPSPYVRDLIDYLTKTASIFDIMASVFGKCKVAESWEDNYRRIKLSEAYAKAFRLIADEYATNYGKASETGAKPLCSEPSDIDIKPLDSPVSQTDEKPQRKVREKETFASCIIDIEQADEIRRKITARLNERGRGGKQAAIIINAAASLGWIRKPNSGVMLREFNVKKSGYCDYIDAYLPNNNGLIKKEDIEAEKMAIQLK